MSPANLSTCCEGQATRLLASLPEYLVGGVDGCVLGRVFEYLVGGVDGCVLGRVLKRLPGGFNGYVLVRLLKLLAMSLPNMLRPPALSHTQSCTHHPPLPHRQEPPFH